MKGRPHIILRFSKHVAPPGEEPLPSPLHLLPPTEERRRRRLSSSSSDTLDRKQYRTTTTRNSALSPGDSAQTVMRPAATRRRKKNSKTEVCGPTMTAKTIAPGGSGEAAGEESTTSSDEGAPRRSHSVSPAASSIGKRKRDIPMSIGGGKGDLQPPINLKRPKRPVIFTPATNGTSTSSEPSSAKKDEEKRVLRSQDTTKRSEYEEWFEAPEARDDLQMPIDIKELHPRINGVRPHTPTPQKDAPPTASLLSSPLKAPLAKPAELASEVTRIRKLPIQKFNFEEELRGLNARPNKHLVDPLGDEVYIQHHLTAGRREKRNKNIERELLHHNAIKISKDLENLHSPDWIKLIGLSSPLVARCSKKELEQRKEALVSHLEATLEKFKAWNKGEKRKRNQGTSTSPNGSQERDTEENDDSGEGDDDVDSSHDEDEGTKSTRRGKKVKPLGTRAKKDLPKAEPEFTSFYDTVSQRQQALSTRRKSFRTQTAFGRPLPTIEEKEFELSEDLIADSIAARHLRARKRLSK